MIVKYPGVRFSEGLTLMGFYTVSYLHRDSFDKPLSPNDSRDILRILRAVHDGLPLDSSEEGRRYQIKAYFYVLAIMLLGEEYSLLLSIGYLPGLNVLALSLKAIYLVLLSISIIELASLKGSNKLRTYGLLTMIGSFLIIVPTEVTVIIALILLPLGLFGAGGLLKGLYSENVPN